MRILVVCGAGASSTFVAQRLRHAAQAAGRPISATAGTVKSLPIDLDAADVVLVGPHLQDDIARIERAAAARAVTVVHLTPDVFTDVDGTHTLALVDAALPAAESRAAESPAAESPAAKSPAVESPIATDACPNTCPSAETSERTAPPPSPVVERNTP
ncbi:PTS sugar transporter subunit IIB [Microbacterium sp. bgisy203]|uniref:PTS sugar transporter subunit IIB n=1 Tax=Microbacterium sp. bgisy203 TaxID=3413799 RepID=UPI003D75A859